MRATRPLSIAALAALLWAAPAIATQIKAQTQAEPPVRIVPGSVAKLCQMVGEADRPTGQPTVNATASRYGFWGTDLGVSFTAGGHLWFLFGDTHPAPGIVRPPDADLIAMAEGTDAAGCPRLSFPVETDGAYRPLQVPGVSAGAFEVPTGGFEAAERMYVIVTTGRRPGRPMDRSVLAASDDGGAHFRAVSTLSSRSFVTVAPVVVAGGEDGRPDLPTGPGAAVLFFGTGDYRASAARLAASPANGVEDPAARRYFAGLRDGRPVWSPREDEAAPLFDAACMGELSVARNAALGRWVMLYNCAEADGRSRILMRSAAHPWGPWSEPRTLFDPARDGDCRFIQAPDADRRPDCPTVGDPHQPTQPGDAYAAYLVPSMDRAEPRGRVTVHFTLSTWNPYTVVLMRAALEGGTPTQTAERPR